MNLALRLIVGLVIATLLRSAIGAVLPAAVELVDPFIVVVVWLSVGRSPLAAQLIGLAVGLSTDVFAGGPFGLHGFADTAVGYTVARFAQHLLMRQPRTLALVFALAVVAQQTLIAALEVLLVPVAVVPSPTSVAIRIVLTTLLGLAWLQVEGAGTASLERQRRERASKLRLGR